MIVGTAGHVDHGKTSLVRALTGVDTDRLAEEKARGISIELGFAYAVFEDGPQPARIGFVDVPGHRKFVQTMIAGAAGVDVGLLVIAADDGPMPQTREHLAILRWVGVKDVVVALTKIDLVDETRLAEATAEVEALIGTTPFRDVPIVPVSVVGDAGLAALKAVLLARAPRVARVPAPRFRLAIDRAFTLQGIGLVVTGTCYAGQVAVDDAVTLLPGGLVARVRGIRAHDETVEIAHAGQRVALNLVGRGVERDVVQRGMWAVAADIAIETDRIDVVLQAEAEGDTAAATTIGTRDWRAVRFHSGATSCNARVVALSAAQPALAQVVLERPVHVVAGDRFVLRDGGMGAGPGGGGADDASGSIAGGIVLDVDVPARGRRAAERLRFLAAAAAGDAAATLAQAIEDSAKGIDLARWNATHNTAFAAATVAARARVRAVGSDATATLFPVARWDAMQGRIVDVLAAEHARAPDAVGPGRDRLRRMAAPSTGVVVFGALLDALKEDGRLAQTGAWLHLPSHRVELSAVDRTRFERIGPLLATAPNNPPRVRDLAKSLGDDEAAVRSVLVRLAALGEVYRVAHDHYFLPDAVRALAAGAAAVAGADGVARAAPFRDRIGVGRKVAIQILEFFDRVGYTRRLGDDHRIIQPALFDG